MITLIDINLSEEYERQRRKAMPRKHVPAAFGVATAISIALMAVFYVFVFLQSNRLGRSKSELTALRPRYDESLQLQTLRDNLRTRADALAAWNGACTRWSERWLTIAKTTPEAIYLTEIEVQPADPQCDSQRLRLQCRAHGPSGENDIQRFVANLKRATQITNYFRDIKLLSITTAGAEKSFALELSHAPTP